MNNKYMKRNPGTKADNEPKLGDWEHKLVVDKYIEWYTIHREGRGVDR